MDELLAQERAAHDYVKSLQSHQDTPFKDTLAAFDQYRSIVQRAVFTKFSQAEKLETRLWQQHTETRQLLARTLKDLRRMKEQKAVEIRYAVEMYLRFIKQSTRFYRSYIHHLSTHFGGIPELQAVAHQVKPATGDDLEETEVDAELRQQVLHSCHRSLLYLGDLCRYRATDSLDSQQDFGPAIGFYTLACTLRPEAGVGYHQQSIVALEQRDHLRVIYFLYREFLVDEPVPIAKKHLASQYQKLNTAWDNGELIVRGPPHDSAAHEKAMVGLFLRLHSVCVQGEVIRGYEELLHELLTRLKLALQQRPLDAKLLRMVFVSIGAQHTAMDNYKDEQTTQNEQAFYYSIHINIVFLTTLLEVLQVELAHVAKDPALVTAELPDKVTALMAQILPALRLYSNWLLLNKHLVLGLESIEFLAPAFQRFWLVYAQLLDLISAVFPIWDLEDCEQVVYLLEEEVESLGYLPLQDEKPNGPVKRTLLDFVGQLKVKFSDADVLRLNASQEAVARIFRLLEAGSYIANNVDGTPINIRGTRFILGHDAETFTLPRPPTPPPVEKPQPLSYAAAAAKLNGLKSLSATPAPASTRTQDMQPAHHVDQLERMVDNLVDDEDKDLPITPPQPYSAYQTVISGTGDVQIATGVPFDGKPGYNLGVSPSSTIVPATAMSREMKQSTQQTSKVDLTDFSPRPKLLSDKVLWSPNNTNSITSTTNHSNPHSQLNSPAQLGRTSHQRGGSSTSIRSAASPHLGESWSSIESAPRAKRYATGSFSNGIAASGASQQELTGGSADRSLSSPQQVVTAQHATSLLFGPGSIWNSNSNVSPRADFGG